jgi:O-antigen ligase
MLAAVALIVIALCYLGVLFAPSLSIHQLTDYIDTEHAGLWRGIYTQKNTAGAMMVLFVFVGMFAARMRSFALGAFIVVAASIFLLFTGSKTDISAIPIVLILAAVIGRGRKPTVAITIIVGLIAVLNLLSVGTIYFEPVRNLVQTVIPDATFTGRTEIWDFALRYAAQRPILGYGFSTFWGTEEAVYGLGENASWVNAANDAHNAYINLALTIGIPGLILVILWLVALPLIDYYRSPREPSIAPLKMLFLRICLFAAFGSCFESLFFGVGGIWFFLVTATFGLRFLSVTRVAT